MNAFMSEMTRITRLLATDPSSGNEVLLIWISIVVISTASINIMGKTLRSTFGYSLPRSVAISLVSTAVLLISIVTTNLYLIPMAGQSSLRGVLPGFLVIVAVAGIAAPFCLWLHKTKYSKALVTILLSITCSAAAVMMIRAGFTAARNSKASAIQMKNNAEKAGKLSE